MKLLQQDGIIRLVNTSFRQKVCVDTDLGAPVSETNGWHQESVRVETITRFSTLCIKYLYLGSFESTTKKTESTT